MSTEAENEEPKTRERPNIPVTVGGGADTDDDAGDEAGEESEDGAGTGEGEGDGASDGAGDGEEGQEGPGGEETAAGEEAEAPKTRQPWQAKRIGKLKDRAETAEQKLADAEAKIAALEAQSSEGGKKLYTEAEIRGRIESEATQKANARAIDQKLDTIFEQGTKAHKDFAQRVDGYVQAFGKEALQQRPDFFEAVAELPNGADVIHALGGDLDHMAEILEMPGYKMGMALADLSTKLAKPTGVQVSKVPAPIRPLEVVNKAELPLTDPRVPMDDWVQRRRAERQAHRAAKGR